MEQVALAHRLDHERVLAGRRASARRRRRAPPEPRRASPGSATCGLTTESSARSSRPGREGRRRARSRAGGSSPAALAHRGDARERLGRRLAGAVDRRLVVGERDEPGLELRGGRVDAAVEQRAAEARRRRRGRSSTRAAKSRTGSAAKNGVTRPGTEATWIGDARRLGGVPQAGGEVRGEHAEPLVGARVELAPASRARRRPRAGCPRACPPGRRRRRGRSGIISSRRPP